MRWQTPVIVLSGEAARRDFFQAKDLDLTAGFKFLSGAVRCGSFFSYATFPAPEEH